MKKIISNIVILSLSVLLMALGYVYAQGDTDVDKQEEILEKIEEELKALDSSHSDFVNQKNTIIRQIRSLEETVKTIEKEIVVINSDIAENNIQIGISMLDLDAAKQALDATNKLLDQRIRIMYKNGVVGYYEVVLNSRSFEDLLVRIEMLGKIVKSDNELVDQQELEKAVVIEKKMKLEHEQVKLVELQANKESKQAELEIKIREFEVKKEEVLKDIRALEIQIDAGNEDAEKVKNIIKDLELRATYVGGTMNWPVPNHFDISSPFGMRKHPVLKINKLHTGIDIAAPKGSKVIAAQGGTIIWSTWLGAYGKAVMIDHGGGIVTLYAHNSKTLLKKGTVVKKGDTIALIGSTGVSTGNHSHFEVRLNGDFQDPMKKWLKSATEF